MGTGQPSLTLHLSQHSTDLHIAAMQTSGVFALMTCAAVAGYWVGVGRSLNLTRANGAEVDSDDEDVKEPAADEKKSPAQASDDESSGDEEQLGDLSQIKPGFMEECKMVLVVRTDLGMTKGKIAAQASHATLACYKSLQASNPGLLKHWERTGQAKIALKADSEDELLVLQAQAQSLNICARSIQDAGRTQIAAGSRTVLGIGPAPVRLINQVTGNLKLL